MIKLKHGHPFDKESSLGKKSAENTEVSHFSMLCVQTARISALKGQLRAFLMLNTLKVLNLVLKLMLKRRKRKVRLHPKRSVTRLICMVSYAQSQMYKSSKRKRLASGQPSRRITQRLPTQTVSSGSQAGNEISSSNVGKYEVGQQLGGKYIVKKRSFLPGFKKKQK